MNVLFILKYRDNSYDCDAATYGYSLLSSGLMNSAKFVCDNLVKEKIDATVANAVDNNDIDHLVTEAKPDVVIIEAYWVVPEKFEILVKLHPTVKWVIRNHSAMPFAAGEGQIMDWSLRYMDYDNVYVSCNDLRPNNELRELVAIYKPTWTAEDVAERVIYLPNYYPVHAHKTTKVFNDKKETLDIACFGAIRPLKNQLIQAIAAIKLADEWGKTLNFHINATRIEGGGNSILQNLRKLFAKLPHKLVEHSWLPHDEFKILVASMDLSLQVSYSETFNIVTADAVYEGVPVVTSGDIKWVHEVYTADPNSSDNIVYVMKRALAMSKLPEWHANGAHHELNIKNLKVYNEKSTEIWKDSLLSITTGFDQE